MWVPCNVRWIGYRGSSDPQEPIATADAGRAGAHRLENRRTIDRLEKSVELRARAGQLDRVILIGDVDDAATKDVRHPLHFFAVLAHGSHLDEHQLAFDVLAFGEI